jgi:mono/diheme cytochrome c family protein
MRLPPPARNALCLALACLCVPGVRGADDLAVRARELLRLRCGDCHGPGGSGKGGFDYVLDRDRLVARNRVVAGNAGESVLLQRIRDGEMPPPKRTALNEEEIALLERWIDAGAPAVAAAAERSLVPDALLLRLVRTDLENLEPRRRRFVRYLTLTHLANAGVPEEELTRHRQALAKLVNSLSWQPRIALPAPIDAGRTVYRIDLRDYKWTARQWDRLAAPCTAPTGAAAISATTPGGKMSSTTRSDRCPARAASSPRGGRSSSTCPTVSRATCWWTAVGGAGRAGARRLGGARGSSPQRGLRAGRPAGAVRRRRPRAAPVGRRQR